MNILVTGANGFMGRNLCQALLQQEPTAVLFRIDLQNAEAELPAAARQADFVFHLAGVNRPPNPEAYMQGNADFTKTLLAMLSDAKKPPVLLSGSTQAALQNPYGQSKLIAEEAVRDYGQRCHTPVYLYRLTNAFGKWSRPNYNSAVATFCHNIACGMPISVSDPEAVLKLNYIDDITAEFLHALHENPHREGEYCSVCPVHEIKLGMLAQLIEGFHEARNTLTIPDQSDPFTRKLYATYLSFLPPDDFSRTPVSHTDARGSFTELLHMAGHGQISVNVSKPHIQKGDHWHHTKHEKFIVLSGEGVIRFRKIGDSTVLSYPVSGQLPTIVDIPPGYTHLIENLGESDMITLMWASECFNPDKPDTFPLKVHDR